MARTRTQIKAPLPASTKKPAAKAPADTTTPDAGDQGEAEEEAEELVTLNCPNAFNLTLDDGTLKRYDIGVHKKVPLSHAEHWYTQAHGATIVE